MKQFLILALVLSSISAFADENSDYRNELGNRIGQTRAYCIKATNENRERCFEEYDRLLGLLQDEIIKDLKIIDGSNRVSSTVFGFETPRTKSLIETQIELINQGIATGQITDETKAFFIESIREMQNGTPKEEGAVAKFTRLVNEGIASGQITDVTKDYFLNAVKELNRK